MIEINIPGQGVLALRHLVLDHHGTLATDGKLLPGAREVLTAASKNLEVHIVTGDPSSLAKSQLEGLPVQLTLLPHSSLGTAKLRYIESLGPEESIAVGNASHDEPMLEAAAIGIAVLQKEGAAARTLLAADIVTNTIWDTFDLLSHPRRIAATLSS